MYNPEYYNWAPQGWRCPQCGKVWSPQTSGCIYCNTERKTFTTTKVDISDAGWWDDYQKRTTGDAEALEQTWKQFTTSKADIEITPSGAILYHGPTMECYL